MKFTNEELIEMSSPSCPECGGKRFTSTDSTFTVGRCMECNTLMKSFGVVPELAAQLLEERRNTIKDLKMFDKYSLPELVKRAKEIFSRDGESGLHNYRYYSDACGCMGPSKGDYLCPCRQGYSLKTNMVEVVAQFDEEMAKRIWLGRFVSNLPG